MVSIDAVLGPIKSAQSSPHEGTGVKFLNSSSRRLNERYKIMLRKLNLVSKYTKIPKCSFG